MYIPVPGKKEYCPYYVPRYLGTYLFTKVYGEGERSWSKNFGE